MSDGLVTEDGKAKRQKRKATPRFRDHPYTCGVYDGPLVHDGGQCTCGADAWNAALTASGISRSS